MANIGIRFGDIDLGDLFSFADERHGDTWEKVGIGLAKHSTDGRTMAVTKSVHVCPVPKTESDDLQRLWMIVEKYGRKFDNITTREGKKMNKVYEGILVRVVDGEIQDVVSSGWITVAKSKERARDTLVLRCATSIDSLNTDWDIIVREWK